MVKFLIFAYVFLLTCITVWQAVRNFLEKNLVEEKRKLMVFLQSAEILLLVCMAVSENFHSAAFSLFLSVNMLGMYSLSLSLAPPAVATLTASGVVVLDVLTAFYMGMGVFLNVPSFPSPVCLVLIPCISLLVCIFLVFRLVSLIRDVKYLFLSSNAWNCLCLSVDVIYIIALTLMSLLYVVAVLFSDAADICTAVYSAFLLSLQAALTVRIGFSTLFVFWRSHENRIIESMRIAQMEVGGESHGVDILYRNIYDRVLDFFENKRPYLNNELTINDVVDVIVTNKLYISKAINIHTGRNFCQFVNYYRVRHAISLFRSNVDMKVVEMASKSGFNSPVSFSMAFRLFMGEKPSDWCRKERARMLKGTK